MNASGMVVSGYITADMRELVDLTELLDENAANARQASIEALDRTVVAVHASAVRNAARIRLTGRLMESVDYDTAQRLTRRVFTDDPAGRFQDLGTSRHAPQPWLTPAADEHVPQLIDELREIGAPW